MNEVQAEMAQNTRLNRLGDLIDSAINHAGGENKSEEGKIGHPDQVEEREENRGDEDAPKTSDDRFVFEPKAKFALNKSSEKSFFRDRNKDEIFKHPSKENDGDFRIPFDKVEVKRNGHHDQDACNAHWDPDFQNALQICHRCNQRNTEGQHK